MEPEVMGRVVEILTNLRTRIDESELKTTPRAEMYMEITKALELLQPRQPYQPPKAVLKQKQG